MNSGGIGDGIGDRILKEPNGRFSLGSEFVRLTTPLSSTILDGSLE